MHNKKWQRHFFKRSRELKRKMMKYKFFFLSLSLIFLIGGVAVNIFFHIERYNTAPKITSSELNIADASPNGEISGLVVPASCGTTYEGTSGHEADYTACSSCNVCGSCNGGTSLCGGVCSVGPPAIPYDTPWCNSIGWDIITDQCLGYCACTSGRSYFGDPDNDGRGGICCNNNYGQVCFSNSSPNSCGDFFRDGRQTYQCNGTCPATPLSAPPMPYNVTSCTFKGYDQLANQCTGECACDLGRAYDRSINQCVDKPVINNFTIGGNSTDFYVPFGEKTQTIQWDATGYGATVCNISGSNFSYDHVTSFSEIPPPLPDSALVPVTPLNVFFIRGSTTTLSQAPFYRPPLPPIISDNDVPLSGSWPVSLYSGVYSITCKNVAGFVSKEINVTVVCPPVIYEWSTCTKSCGGGTRIRRDTNCFHNEVLESCNTQKCVTSSWKEITPPGN